MKQKLLSMLFALLCLVGATYAQERQVSGKVTSATEGTPLAGVSVSVVGTTHATQTDPSGDYTIDIPGDDVTLVFSYVGFNSQRIEVGTQTVLNVQLAADEEALEEVVVTALGITRDKKSLGYAAQEVSGE